jgi:hypothetical protein
MQTQHVQEPQQGYELPNSPTLPDEPYYQQAENNSRRRMGLALLVIGFLWLLIEFNGMGIILSGNRPTDTRLHLPTAPSQIELNLGSGDVDVVVNQSDEFEIVANYRGPWQGEPLAHSQSGDRLTVNNNAHRGPFGFGFCFGKCDLNYHVSIPADSQLILQTSSGDIVLKGSLERPQISSSSGDIRLENAELGATITSSSGNIRLNHVAGQVDLKTTSGDIKLNNGRITDSRAESTSGDIELNGVVGELHASTTSGDINIKDIKQGQVDLRSMSGELCAEGELVGTSTLETTSGDVELRLVPNSNITINATTISGDINASKLVNQQGNKRELHGQLGDGSATININTTSGDIRIK